MSETEIAGGCLCGIVRYRVTNTPPVHYCHCEMCRRATGSAFAVLAWKPVDALFWTSGRRKYRRSSPLAERGFCENCGTPLTLAYDANQDELALHAGTLDAPERFEPRYNYGASQRLGWVRCGIGLPNRNTEERW
ncbi:GFA family protein [Mesorhizobium sp. WSM4884]|nr:GFA family protein [Mesorhizobium sp. WSM4884]MDG4881943.1 GFA family protein [Mesorhizobium sp. WSM4884]